METVSVIHTTPYLAASDGGPSVSVPALCKSLKTVGCDVSLCAVGNRDDVNTARVNNRSLHFVGVERSIRFHRYEYTRGLRQVLSRVVEDAEILHSHGLWTQVSRDSAVVAAKKHRPHVLSPRGMLEPWALNHSKRKKQIAGWIFQNRALRDTACLHATAEQEWMSIREYGLTSPVAVIPNGVDIRGYGGEVDRTEIERRWPETKNKQIVFFVSRIHPSKGLLNLASAWGNLCARYRDWQLLIAGPDENEHEAAVRRAVEVAGASRSTTFAGPVYGTLKTQLYAACDLFVLPTFSENFGSVVAEALASGKPVITTKGTPWRELESCKCGWWIDIGAEPLKSALRQAIELPDRERHAMGLRGRELVERSYSWLAIAEDTLAVYRWILGRGPQPECVRLN